MTEEHNLLVVSDLHLSAGLDPDTGTTSRLEDFCRDDAFQRFLRYHEEIKEQPRFGDRPWLLVLNGDIFDFLQVICLPQDGRLLKVIKDAEGGLTAHERMYGLGTTALESEWKLKQIARGHQSFFAALGWFVGRGNSIAVVRGNHDVELYWEEVRERFVVETRRAHVHQWLREGGEPPPPAETYRARIQFYPWFYYEPGRIYVEHGCQYDALNHFEDFLCPVLSHEPQRIALPWGSLFVRYLFNRVEDVHPFADNVKPLTRYLSWAFRQNPVRALAVLVGRGWTFLRAVWLLGQKARAAAISIEDEQTQTEGNTPTDLPPEIEEAIRMLARRQVDSAWQAWVGSLMHTVVSLLSLLIVGTFAILALVTLAFDTGPRWLAAPYAAAAVVAALLRYALKEGFSYLLERDDLLQAASELDQILAREHPVPIIAMGHNHRPSLERLDGTWYVNTGAWVRLYHRHGPIGGREALTFLRVAEVSEEAPALLRWYDTAGAPARMTLRRDLRTSRRGGGPSSQE